MTALLLGACCCSRTPEYSPAVLRCAAASAPPVELVLEQALPIDGPEDFQPSGLAVWGEHLLAISDKHDGAVFELTLTATSAQATPWLRFRPPDDERLDLEAIAVERDGTLLLASEAL